ncbi:MAG: response regulator, partial [bacterium]
ESGRMVLRASSTNITQYLKGIIQSFESLAERKKITLKFNINEKLIIGYVDRDKLEKIVTNLLSNAFKFTPEGGKICVDFSPTPLSIPPPGKRGKTGGVEIHISNTGSGIPSDQLDKIFDRFYQANDSYSKDSEGSGIGLALTKELVEAHHGEIGVESELNKGTTFTVWLPIEKEHFKPEEIVDIFGEEVTSLSPPLPRGEERGGETIETIPLKKSAVADKSAPLLLIIEDNPDVTRYISSFLEKEYRIITAENGKAGLKKTLDKSPDLIISDVMMPEMDGFQFCRQLKSDQCTSHIPFILLTARADMESKLEGLEFGADDYVTKPFDAKELSVRSKNLLEQRRRLQEHFERKVEFQPSEITVNSMDEKFMQRAIALIERHMDDTEFSAEQFSREIGMSRRHLNRKLHSLTNYPARDFIRTIRLKRAAQLLQKNSDPVTQIAYQVGFSNPSYFTECFKSQFGMSPTEYASRES